MNEASTKNKFHKKFIYILLFLFIFNSNSYSLDNKILLKIENQIITSIDLENEFRYLLALNKNLLQMDRKRMLEYSKNSLVREKIKKIALLKNIENFNLSDEYIEKILKNIYEKIGIKNLNDFKNYLKTQNIDYQFVKNKIEIEAKWNEFIYAKFHKKINLNKEELRKEILKRQDINSYDLSEILFEVSKSEDLEKKYKDIKKLIEEESFENASIIFSVSDSAKNGGKLGWIRQDSLNTLIQNKISKLKINQITEPITIPQGFLILKLNNKKIIQTNIDVDLELKKLINLKTNEQLNQFSRIYFNKFKKDLQIYEN